MRRELGGLNSHLLSQYLVFVSQLIDLPHELQILLEIETAVAVLVNLVDDFQEVRSQPAIGGHFGERLLNQPRQLCVLNTAAPSQVVAREVFLQLRNLFSRVSVVYADHPVRQRELLAPELQEPAQVYGDVGGRTIRTGRPQAAAGRAPDALQRLVGRLPGQGPGAVAVVLREQLLQHGCPLLSAQPEQLAELEEPQGTGAVDVHLRDVEPLLLEGQHVAHVAQDPRDVGRRDLRAAGVRLEHPLDVRGVAAAEALPHAEDEQELPHEAEVELAALRIDLNLLQNLPLDVLVREAVDRSQQAPQLVDADGTVAVSVAPLHDLLEGAHFALADLPHAGHKLALVQGAAPVKVDLLNYLRDVARSELEAQVHKNLEELLARQVALAEVVEPLECVHEAVVLALREALAVAEQSSHLTELLEVELVVAVLVHVGDDLPEDELHGFDAEVAEQRPQLRGIEAAGAVSVVARELLGAGLLLQILVRLDAGRKLGAPHARVERHLAKGLVHPLWDRPQEPQPLQCAAHVVVVHPAVVREPAERRADPLQTFLGQGAVFLRLLLQAPQRAREGAPEGAARAGGGLQGLRGPHAAARGAFPGRGRPLGRAVVDHQRRQTLRRRGRLRGAQRLRRVAAPVRQGGPARRARAGGRSRPPQ
mmetsp:Transcript_114065/g.322971  ORF Transcript_114065/g.322971 Transcript_114065/m.322971 type:complete len:650 (-) Transcript_114065:445-2394(-)